MPPNARYCGNCGAPIELAAAPARSSDSHPAAAAVSGVPGSVTVSSPLRRLGAFALDSVLVLVTLVIGWLIWSLIVWGRGQSPGKQLLGMRVVRSDTHRVASWGRMALRELICKQLVGLAAAITVIGLVLYLWLLWDEQNQELWDKMASTLVVDDPAGALAP